MSRSGESGQALMLALLALLLASIAAGLVAEDVILRERAMAEEAVRARLRGMLDGALADALGRVAARQMMVEREPLGGGFVGEHSEVLPANSRRVEVWANYAGRWAAAVAIVEVPLRDPPRVISWQREPAAKSGPR